MHITKLCQLNMSESLRVGNLDISSPFYGRNTAAGILIVDCSGPTFSWRSWAPSRSLEGKKNIEFVSRSTSCIFWHPNLFDEPHIHPGLDFRWESTFPISSFSISSVDPFWMNRSLEFRSNRGKWRRVALRCFEFFSLKEPLYFEGTSAS